MAGFLDHLRQKITSSVWKEEAGPTDNSLIDDKIALGVLLWEVAQADEKFLPDEKEKVEHVLKEFGGISAENLPYVVESIKVAADEKIDLYAFTREVSQNLPRSAKISILEDLFRVACIDEDLDSKEHEMIRKISDLFRLDHKEFIDAKVKVKKEFGMDTAGL